MELHFTSFKNSRNFIVSICWISSSNSVVPTVTNMHVKFIHQIALKDLASRYAAQLSHELLVDFSAAHTMIARMLFTFKTAVIILATSWLMLTAYWEDLDPQSRREWFSHAKMENSAVRNVSKATFLLNTAPFASPCHVRQNVTKIVLAIVSA